jgi:hypothetical protein
MNAGLITSILSVVAVVIPLIIPIIVILRSRIEAEPLDSPSLKIQVIKRIPVDDKIWMKIRRHSSLYFPNIKTYIFLLLVYYFLVYLLFVIYNRIFIGAYINLLILTAVIAVIYGLLKSSSESQVSEDVRYVIFKNAEIIVEANFHYLFNKCHETLRSMHFNVVEVNEITSSLEAYRGKGWTKGTDRIKIQIDQVKHSERSYIIKLEFENVKDLPEDSNITYSFIKRLIQNSKVTNRFINRLISISKKGDEKDEV